MGLLVRLLIVTALICSPLLLVLPRSLWWTLLPAGALVLSLIAGWLGKQFNEIYRLRYLEGRPDRALKMLGLWQLLLPLDQLAMVKSEALLQAGRVEEVQELSRKESLPPWLRANLRHVLAQKSKDHAAAEAALRDVLSSGPPEQQRVAAHGEMARLLAEHFPERLEEARRHLEQARSGHSQPPMSTLLEGIEGILDVSAGSPTQGIATLQKAADGLGTTNVLTLPFVAEFHRWMGRGYRATGHLERAREELLTARTLTKIPSLLENCDQDLAAL